MKTRKMKVQLINLNNPSQRHLNNVYGFVTGNYDNDKKRYPVRIVFSQHGKNTVLNILAKTSNLKLISNEVLLVFFCPLLVCVEKHQTKHTHTKHTKHPKHMCNRNNYPWVMNHAMDQKKIKVVTVIHHLRQRLRQPQAQHIQKYKNKH